MLKTVGFPSTRTGDQTIVDGNLVIGTAGKGIDFSADPAAPGMTSELLDDYEEGTWTPSVGGDATYFHNYGSYVKVGRHVTVTGFLYLNAIGTGSTTVLSGLPFTSETTYQKGCLSFGEIAEHPSTFWITVQIEQAPLTVLLRFKRLLMTLRLLVVKCTCPSVCTKQKAQLFLIAK
jgi:hypothetical protein